MRADQALAPRNPVAAPPTSRQGALSIPQARGLPLLGCIPFLLANPLQFLLTQRRRLGPVFRVRAPGRDMVVLSGVEANRFMSEEGKDCFVSARFWGGVVREWQCPHFISATDGAVHIDERRALKPSMSRTVADARQQGLVEIVHETVGRYARGGSPFSMRELARTLTNAELYYLLTGERLKLSPALGKALAEYQRITFNVLVLGKWPRLMLKTPGYLLSRRRALAFIARLRKRFEAEPPADGYFRAALERHRSDPARRAKELDFAFLAPFWAGLDTLGSSFVFLVQQLVLDRSLLERVRSELDEAIRKEGLSGIPSPETLRKLPLLYGLCMETLRLYPVAFASGRTAARDFTFQGYRIAKGQDVMILTSATHFENRYFKDPLEFDIERYSAPRNEHRTKYAFNPFGRGPHICLGAAMAESMMLTTVATLLRDYELEAAVPGKRYPMIFDPSPTLPAAFAVSVRRR